LTGFRKIVMLAVSGQEQAFKTRKEKNAMKNRRPAPRKLLAAGLLIAIGFSATAKIHAADANLDPNFGTAGKVTTDFGFGDEVRGVAIQSESALVTSLPDGNYTAIVRGKDNTTGVAVVEVYSVL
jgi:hypothetical protein